MREIRHGLLVSNEKLSAYNFYHSKSLKKLDYSTINHLYGVKTLKTVISFSDKKLSSPLAKPTRRIFHENKITSTKITRLVLDSGSALISALHEALSRSFQRDTIKYNYIWRRGSSREPIFKYERSYHTVVNDVFVNVLLETTKGHERYGGSTMKALLVFY